MGNTKVTKDLSDNIKAAAILADFFGFKPTYTDTAGSRGGQLLSDKSGSNKVVTFKGSNNIPLKIGDNWYFCDTDADITLPNDLDDYLADDVVEDGTGTWTAGDNVTFSTDAGQVKLAVAAAAGATQNIGYIDFAAKDFSATGKNAISFLITSSINLVQGSLQFRAGESAAIATPAESLAVPALKAGVQTRVILSFASAAAARDAIISIGLYAVTDFGAANIWIDDIKTTSIEAGKDYFVYACDNAGALALKVSKASTYPAGFAAATSRKIGGLHTLALAVGTIAGHTLSTFDTADINPYSIWDLKHRPRSNPAGMAYSSKTGKWGDIYLVSGTGASSLSVNGGTISDTRDWLSFVDDAGSVGKRLMTDSEFQCIATGSNEETNILASADPVTAGPHIDTAGRRMISNIGCEDMCGAMWQWLLDQSYRFDAAAAHTHQVTVSGNPETVTSGNPSGDVAPAWAWYDLPGVKGSLYKQGTYGDVKLSAGGLWYYAAACGSRARLAGSSRWLTYTAVGARFVSEPL